LTAGFRRLYCNGTDYKSRKADDPIFKNITGIIAEYNPLHNGHLYHIRKTRENGSDGIIVALSSYFTQRGEPALLSKWDRAESALSAGANLVLELPAFFSCHNAGIFASGAVDILTATGLVRSLSFGMEQPECDVEAILNILVQEPQYFKDNLKKFLNSGFSYVKARAHALAAVRPEFGTFVSSPNNSLALAYMERIRKKGYPVTWNPVGRIGAGFHDICTEPSGFPSATAIRKNIREGKLNGLENGIPESSAAVLSRCLDEGRIVASRELLWRMARYMLLGTPASEIALSSEMTEGMENRFLKFAPESTSWDEFVSRCVTGRYPRGRVQRQLIHFLLGIRHDENRQLQESGPAYIRVLGADRGGLWMLRKMRKTSAIPVAGKHPVSGDRKLLMLSEIETRACRLWETLTGVFSPGYEKKRRPLIRTEEYSGEEGSVPEDGGTPREEPFHGQAPRTGRSP